MLKYIWHWRETQSQKADLPPFKIMINSAMIALAGWASGHRGKSISRGPRLARYANPGGIMLARPRPCRRRSTRCWPNRRSVSVSPRWRSRQRCIAPPRPATSDRRESGRSSGTSSRRLPPWHRLRS